VGDYRCRKFCYRIQLVAGARTGFHLDQNAMVQHCSRRSGRCSRFPRPVACPFSRSAFRRCSLSGFSSLFLDRCGCARRGGHFVRFSFDRLLGGNALLGLKGSGAARGCVERSGFFARAAFLFVQSAILFRGSRFRLRVGHSLRAGLLDHGQGLAIVSYWRKAEKPRSRSRIAAAARSDAHRLRARHWRHSVAWTRGMGLPRQLRSRVQLPRFHDRRRLRG
jgi:hypothetical protein